MRLWSLHPRYLDPQGLVALWREALLAQAVLHDATRGYRHHPQLARFRQHPEPHTAIACYLHAVHAEAQARGYTFDSSRIKPAAGQAQIIVTSGQLQYEWSHLLAKLQMRNAAVFQKWQGMPVVDAHPMFSLQPGGIAPWERP